MHREEARRPTRPHGVHEPSLEKPPAGQEPPASSRGRPVTPRPPEGRIAPRPHRHRIGRELQAQHKRDLLDAARAWPERLRRPNERGRLRGAPPPTGPMPQCAASFPPGPARWLNSDAPPGAPSPSSGVPARLTWSHGRWTRFLTRDVELRETTRDVPRRRETGERRVEHILSLVEGGRPVRHGLRSFRSITRIGSTGAVIR